jgi:predicted Rossmann fold flavoprotein
MMRDYAVCVIGAGASGITSAISARRKGASVIICERMSRLGKKILASGNGRCNLLNERLDESNYNLSSRHLVKSIFNRFGKEGIIKFFKGLGLATFSDENNRIFPVTNQSASVLKVLEMELERLSIPIELNYEVVDISRSANRFTVMAKSNKAISCDSVIVAGGGKSYPALGSDGNAYKLATVFGHKLIAPVPAAVPIVIKSPLCHILQGQKIFAKATAIIGGKVMREATGDLLFTKYGLSGTAILDVSEEISIAMNRNDRKDVVAGIDIAPFMKEEHLKNEIRCRINRKFSTDELLVGILPNKFAQAIKGMLETRDAQKISSGLKDMRLKVAGTHGWNEAEFTAGGINTAEVKEDTLESKLQKGLYLAGEILDVNGRRGGYNLAWAWASGFIAGENASYA